MSAETQSQVPPRAEELLATELPRLLAEGHEGRWAVVKGEAISVWDTVNDAIQAADERFGLEPFLLREVLPEPRIYRVGWGYRKIR